MKLWKNEQKCATKRWVALTFCLLTLHPKYCNAYETTFTHTRLPDPCRLRWMV